jgi:hypothetical protein
MPYGYSGNILHVNLTKGTLEIETPPEMFYRKYMGGSAMGMVYILREMPKGTDPLSPDNVMTVMLGVTTGASISGQSPLAFDRRYRRFAGGRLLPGRDEVRRFRRDRHQGEISETCLPHLDQR